MIIVSQDKETIMNFDNSTTIRLYKYSTGYEIEACLTNGHISTLGNYATKDRAKEILRMIVSAYQSCKLFQCANNATQEEMAKKYQEFSITPFKFEMPQE